MGNKKKKIKSALKKGWGGAKKGYKKTSEAIMTYGPKVHKGLSKMSRGIQEGMAVTPRVVERKGRMVMHKPRPKRKDMYLKIGKHGKSRMVDFNKLAIGGY